MSNKPIKVELLEHYLKSAFPCFIFGYEACENKRNYDKYIEKVAGEIFFNFILQKDKKLNEPDTDT